MKRKKLIYAKLKERKENSFIKLSQISTHITFSNNSQMIKIYSSEKDAHINKNSRRSFFKELYFNICFTVKIKFVTASQKERIL